MADIFDLIVIGAGPGGYVCAIRAAQLGLKVAIVEKRGAGGKKGPELGGTCLNVGCIPSKALLHVAQILREADDAAEWGIKYTKPKIDLDKVRKTTQDVVSKMTGGLGQLAKARKITYMQGRGAFIDSQTIRVHDQPGDHEDVTFDYAIVATGSRPSVVPHLAIESPRMMNSTDALELADVPETLLVIGGGYIGLELGTVYAALGSRVSVVDVLPRILAGADKDIAKALEKRMREITDAIYLETQVERIEEADDGLDVYMTGDDVPEKPMRFAKVLMSVGRKPNTSGIGLEETGAKINDQGFVEVDEQMRTADPKIFAIGDLVGPPMLAHKATCEGIVAAEVIAGQPSAFDAQCIPAVVFTDPEVAWVGVTDLERVVRIRTGESGREAI